MPAVLIIGFRRSENLNKLLHLVKSRGASRIYLALDGPRNDLEQVDTELCRDVVRKFGADNPHLIILKDEQVNLGSAVSVLTACDWIFSQEDFAIVIEDDCFPSLDFFDYVLDARQYLDSDSRISLICGTQFAPSFITESKWSLSSYPLIWGWATSNAKWNQLRKYVLASSAIETTSKNISPEEFVFWAEGSRRALEGYVDAWDTPLVFGMRKNNALAILPGVNLVSNGGDDQFATHNFKNSKWIRIQTGNYAKSSDNPLYNRGLDEWLMREYFRIRSRHLLSTKITRVLDIVGFNKRIRTPLKLRWN
jgi:hypothetical protein